MSDLSAVEVLATNHYFDKHFSCDAVKLLPGDYYVSRDGKLLVTVLGSCVAACIRDRKSGIGGMNHFMLPDSADGGGGNGGMAAMPTRFGSYAMEMLINHLIKLGAERRNLEAKVFGGGKVLKGFTVNNVGERNAEFVLKYLKTEGIPVTAEDLLDIYPRKVFFFPDTGKVMVRKLKDVHNTTIIDREKIYSERLSHVPSGGSAELF